MASPKGKEYSRPSCCQRPALLIGDEPTGNLDSSTAEGVLELFTGLCRDEKVTLVMVTHDPLLARKADRIIEIRDGVVAGAEQEAAT